MSEFLFGLLMVVSLPFVVWGFLKANRAAYVRENHRQLAERLASERAFKEADLKYLPAKPTGEAFQERLLSDYRKDRTVILAPKYLERVTAAMADILQTNFNPPPRFHPGEGNPYDLLAEAFVEGLNRLTARADPAHLHDLSLAETGPDFLIQRSSENTPSLPLFQLAAPLREFGLNKYFYELGSMDVMRGLKPPPPSDDMRQYKADLKHFETLRKERLAHATPEQTVLANTVFFPHAHKLTPAPVTSVSRLHLDDNTRFSHTFIVGPPKAGKTTLLSKLIADDLIRVARNEASVFVMDSQNELIPQIARLDVFASDGPLSGKLVYLEPHPDFPLALNVFDIQKARHSNATSEEQMTLEEGAIWMVEFFLNSIVKADASPQQDTYLNYVIQAVLAIPDATVFTLIDLLRPEEKDRKTGRVTPSGYERYKDHFNKLRPQTQRWLVDRMLHPELAITRNAIRNRLDGFVARGLFHDMLQHPRNKFDLFTELQSAKVVVVNTKGGMLKTQLEPFGRYFIARLLQSVQERALIDKNIRLPVFAYIDEASDYIADEGRVADLIDDGRKQKFGATFAVQGLSQINHANAKAALTERTAIQFTGNKQPIWDLSIDRAEPIQIRAPLVEFDKMPQMSNTEWEAIITDMRSRYTTAINNQPAVVLPKPTPPQPTMPPNDPPTGPANY